MAADDDGALGAVIRRDEREHVAVIGAVPPRKIDPAHEKRCREGIRARGIRGDDACADDAVGGPAGPRIDDMTVAAPVGDDELLPGAARAKRRVPQLQHRDRPLRP